MNELDAKIAELRDYFARSRLGVSVYSDWDFDRKCATFRFDENHRFYLLKISDVVLKDYGVNEIMKMLGKADWGRVLDGLADAGVAIFTSEGFKPERGSG